MGLCKCPKRRITNQFCFEHRVNVCEHCMMTNHPKCVVQSYLQWLKDCDYNPICELCNGTLSGGECIRLTCYHIFHWNCLSDHGKSRPYTTGPAGFTCPTCNTCLFPASNLVSPVADLLREKLASVNWARAGLGLPLLIEKEAIVLPEAAFQPEVSSRPHAVVHIDPSTTFPHQHPRRVVSEDHHQTREPLIDRDENKYKRLSLVEWTLKKWKDVWRPVPRGRNFFSRYIARLTLVLFLICACVVLLSWLGSIVTRDDPSLEIHNNPNIRIEGVHDT